MALEKWKQSKPLINKRAIEEVEDRYGISLSEDLKNCILKNNGGRPCPNTIELKNGEENDIKLLLSYNEQDVENIYKVIDYFIEQYDKELVPFASDSAGNYYCEQKRHIVLWTQNNEIFRVANSFKQFLEKIYEI